MAVIYQDTTNKYNVDSSFYSTALEHSGLAAVGNVLRAFGESVSSTLGGDILWKPLFGWLTTHDEVRKDTYSSQQEFLLEGDKLNAESNKTTVIIVAVAIVIIAYLLLKK